jgi:hypothetical protein
VIHDGRWGCLYRFLVEFPLINWPCFFSINENGKSCLVSKKKFSYKSTTLKFDLVKVKYEHLEY